jgi:glyoxylase-like metal-dependent hydrolase (beta-lactamase superfamily II)
LTATSHNHEITSGLVKAKSTLSWPLVGHAEMQKYFSESLKLGRTIETDGYAKLRGRLEATYTSGHTDNNICYR